MIRSVRHRGLRRLFEQDNASGLKQDQVKRIARALFLLDNAASPDQIDRIPGLRVHRLGGGLAGLWSMSVSGNWRIVVRFEGSDAFDVDLVDYR
ncbi:MAG TPA: type II toxin-antitoxin system RelE/ParE family toxin [Acetobacteraceae bacterium]|nr:type II toxin-antitoxin system RelE/ParE family toxin [Acetobacteraceae bacterium]